MIDFEETSDGECHSCGRPHTHLQVIRAYNPKKGQLKADGNHIKVCMRCLIDISNRYTGSIVRVATALKYAPK